MRDMKHILHLVQSLDISGRSKVIYDLCRKLTQDGFEPLIVSLTSNRRFLEHYNNVRCVCLDKKEGLHLSIIWKLRGIVKHHNVQILHTHGRGALPYGLILKGLGSVKSVIHTVHRADGDAFTGNWFVKRLIAHYVDRVVVVSGSARERFAAHYDYPLSKIDIVHNGIEVADAVERVAKETPGRLVLGTVANLSYDKDFTTLLSAFQKIAVINPEAELVVVGDGPRAGEIQKLSYGLGLSRKVKFLGFRTDVPDILSTFDIFVLSSHTEGFGMSILEAMAAQVPVIASNVGGIKEVIEDGISGKLFEYGDSEGLKDAVLALSGDEKKRNTLVENGYERVKTTFSVEKMVGGYKKLYSELSAR